MGSYRGWVGRTVASNTRGPRIASSHQQILYWTLFAVNCIDKTNIKKKEAGNGQFLKLKYVTVGLPTNKAAPGSEHTAVKAKKCRKSKFWRDFDQVKLPIGGQEWLAHFRNRNSKNREKTNLNRLVPFSRRKKQVIQSIISNLVCLALPMQHNLVYNTT